MKMIANRRSENDIPTAAIRPNRKGKLAARRCRRRCKAAPARHLQHHVRRGKIRVQEVGEGFFALAQIESGKMSLGLNWSIGE